MIESARMDIELRFAREILRLRGAEILDKEVEAGGSARVRLTLVPYAGALRTRIISIPIPKHLAGEKVTLTIRAGYNVDREKADPENLRDLVYNLKDPIYPPKSVVVSYSYGSAVSFKGQVAKNLPPGALDTIQPESATVAPVPFKSEIRHVTMLPEFMTGQDSVTVDVKPVLR
jgi:hypothetical protein